MLQLTASIICVTVYCLGEPKDIQNYCSVLEAGKSAVINGQLFIRRGEDCIIANLAALESDKSKGI